MRCTVWGDVYSRDLSTGWGMARCRVTATWRGTPRATVIVYQETSARPNRDDRLATGETTALLELPDFQAAATGYTSPDRPSPARLVAVSV